ncbi:LysR family transcriptional regulator [Litoribrevibacter albus]|uniref:Transcriptional regulator n=1 Tax=Litoribrevibacter albus TaxID=1473156 RepID=A0AA37S9N7_9GAMM|nr:LysR family transcriptional regulator [Litoribrevibacter albus]GLQ30991.1 transcriptional regulator [Litoribrevibacter albus]
MIKLDNLNWDDLKYLVAVSRNESLAKAATALKVNHSTVFRRINHLEEALGAKVFIRSSDGYHLSELGMDILNYVEDIVDRVADIQLALDNQNNGLYGQINLTVPHNFGYAFLPKYIGDFQKEHPEIIVNLHVTNNDCNLSKREADLAIRACPAPPDYLVGKHLFSLRWSAYASEEYLAEHGEPETVDDLPRHKLICSHINLMNLPAFKWIRENIPAENIAARSNDLVSMSALAVAGVGIALLPDDQAKPSLKRLFTVDFINPSNIWLLYHPDMRNCRRLKVFKEFLIDKLRTEPLFIEYNCQVDR